MDGSAPAGLQELSEVKLLGSCVKSVQAVGCDSFKRQFLTRMPRIQRMPRKIRVIRPICVIRVKTGLAIAQSLHMSELLKTVWAQQFREAAGQVAFKEIKKYDGHTQIAIPHDPEARYSRKRNSEWVGDKVQVTDPDAEGYPHIITDMVSTQSNLTDYEALPDIQDRFAQRRCQPGEHYLDAGYMSGFNLANSQSAHLITLHFQNRDADSR